MKDKLGIDTTLPYYEVRKFLALSEPGVEFDKNFENLVGLKAKPRFYSTKLDDVIKTLLEENHWWHLSHIEATVILTDNSKPVLNAIKYDENNRPIKYRVNHFGENLAYHLCYAWIKAVYNLPVGYYNYATAQEENEKSFKF